MSNDTMPDYGPRDIEDEYFQEIYRADRILRRAEAGDPEAMTQMGRCFYMGEGRQENYRLALKYLRKPAEMGDAVAQYYCGLIYEDGEPEVPREFRGVPRDPAEARRWLGLAAAQGCEKAVKALERLNGATEQKD